MSAVPRRVYRFKITLRLPNPIWRRILVPETYTFWELSVAIQDAMGNADSRLHFFRIHNPHTFQTELIGTPKDKKSLPFCKVNGAKALIADYFCCFNKTADYVYDNRKGWHYEIRMERLVSAVPGTNYPKCIDGQRANPDHQFRNYYRFVNLADYLEAFKEDDENSKTNLPVLMGEKAGAGDVELEDFDPMSVTFADPKQCLKINPS